MDHAERAVIVLITDKAFAPKAVAGIRASCGLR
jgi:hypothetical protein